MAQEVERRLGKAEATGSNPVISFHIEYKKAKAKFSFCFFVFYMAQLLLLYTPTVLQ